MLSDIYIFLLIFFSPTAIFNLNYQIIDDRNLYLTVYIIKIIPEKSKDNILIMDENWCFNLWFCITNSNFKRKNYYKKKFLRLWIFVWTFFSQSNRLLLCRKYNKYYKILQKYDSFGGLKFLKFQTKILQVQKNRWFFNHIVQFSTKQLNLQKKFFLQKFNSCSFTYKIFYFLMTNG